MKRVLLPLLFLLALIPLSGVARAADDAIRVPLKDVSDKALFKKVDIDGVTVQFFLIKAPDGTVRSALNACEACYPEKKGYRQEGEMMVCDNCGQKFAPSRIGMQKGGCNPHPIANTVEGGDVVISRAELAQGVKFFK